VSNVIFVELVSERGGSRFGNEDVGREGDREKRVK
jgi:hypothetical protein